MPWRRRARRSIARVRQVLFGRGIRWRIFFTVEGSTVQIVHVRHGRRDYWLP